MTSRRRIPTADERWSRRGQFLPGHVGGRVASAQPVRRNSGTLRRPAIGAADPPAPVVVPEPPSGNPAVSMSPFFETRSPTWAPPAGAVTGDLLVYQLIGRYGASFVAPEGWTVALSGSYGDVSWALGWVRFETGVTTLPWTVVNGAGINWWALIQTRISNAQGWVVDAHMVGQGSGGTFVFPDGSGHGFKLPQPHVVFTNHDAAVPASSDPLYDLDGNTSPTPPIWEGTGSFEVDAVAWYYQRSSFPTPIHLRTLGLIAKFPNSRDTCPDPVGYTWEYGYTTFGPGPDGNVWTPTGPGDMSWASYVWGLVPGGEPWDGV